MFTLTFVLEDWAIYELVHSPRRRRQAVILVASAYPTWTYQSHTFSNSIETLLVAWSLVLIERIVREKVVAPIRITCPGQNADEKVEKIASTILWNSLFHARLGCIQSDYISSIHTDTRLAIAATFPF